MTFNIDLTNIDQIAYGVDDSYSSLSVTGALYAPGVQFTPIEFDFWDHQFPMVARLLPLLNNGQPLPSVIMRDGEPALTPWLTRFPVVTCGSTQRSMFILFNPYAERERQVDAKMNPYIVLRKKIKLAAGEKSSLIDPVSGLPCKQVWSSLLEGNQPPLPNFSDNYFAQGICYCNGKELTLENRADGSVRPLGAYSGNKRLIMYRFAKTAGVSLCNTVIDFVRRGIDPIALDKSYYVGIYNDTRCKPVDVDAELHQQSVQTMATAMSGSSMINAAALTAAGASGSHDSKEVAQKYGVHLCRVARLRSVDPPVDFPADALANPLSAGGLLEDILQRYTPLNQCFQILSFKEQAVMIAKSLADLPYILQFGWADTEYLRIPEVAEIAYAQTASHHPLMNGDQSGGTTAAVNAAAAGFGMPASGFGGGMVQQPLGGMQGGIPGMNTRPLAGGAVLPNGAAAPVVNNPLVGRSGVLTGNSQISHGLNSVIGSIDVDSLDLDE